MFPDDADPIVFLKDSLPASYQLISLCFGLLFLSALQKEQVSYLYQLSHSFMGAQLLIIHDFEEFVLTELEKWVHLMQIVSSMNQHALIGANLKFWEISAREFK